MLGLIDNIRFLPLTADFDNDGDIDGRDFLVWQQGGSPNPLSPDDLADWQTNYGTAGHFAGDFDIDGDVDGRDFLAWQRNPSIGDLTNWQTNYGMVLPLAATSTAVPEPSTLIGVFIGVLASTCISKRFF